MCGEREKNQKKWNLLKNSLDKRERLIQEIDENKIEEVEEEGKRENEREGKPLPSTLSSSSLEGYRNRKMWFANAFKSNPSDLPRVTKVILFF